MATHVVTTTSAVERFLDQRERQGLPRRVTDAATLARIAAIVRGVKR